MKRLALSLLTLSLISLTIGCNRSGDAVFLWDCEESALYLNRMDTVCVMRAPLSEYDMYLSVRHEDGLTRNGLKFVISVASPGRPVVEDTLAIPLADTLGHWSGTPYIGAYVQRVKSSMELPESDTAEISLTPVLTEAVRGIDWLALELKRKK